MCLRLAHGHICERLRSTYMPRIGLLGRSNSWVMLSPNFLTFSPNSRLFCFLLVDVVRHFGLGRQSACYFRAPSRQTHFAQGSRRPSEPVPRGGTDPPLDFAAIEPVGGQLQKKHHQISSLIQLPIPRVDQVVDSFGKGRPFPSLTWFLRSIRLRRTKTPFLSRHFATPASLSEWLVMPQGSTLVPRWSTRLIESREQV